MGTFEAGLVNIATVSGMGLIGLFGSVFIAHYLALDIESDYGMNGDSN